MTRSNSVLILSCALALAPFASARSDDLLVAVVAKPVSRIVEVPGELQPFLSVSLHARVPGYVEKVLVDRGSMVKAGQLVVELSAPETEAQIAEVESKIQAAETPGAIAENELVQMQKQIEAGQALSRSRQEVGQALAANLRALKEMQSYLRITAPFDGVITDRLVHPGALVGPGADSPLIVLQQISKLRLVVAVPEEDAGTIPQGVRVEFHVPAFPARIYSATIARSAHALDPKTRTMAVELDVINGDGSLSPGMYSTVQWPIRRSSPALLVPAASVVTTTERTFVIRDRKGHAEWVNVKKGPTDGDLMEVIGPLHPGDRVVRRASDEIREGSSLQVQAK